MVTYMKWMHRTKRRRIIVIHEGRVQDQIRTFRAQGKNKSKNFRMVGTSWLVTPDIKVMSSSPTLWFALSLGWARAGETRAAEGRIGCSSSGLCVFPTQSFQRGGFGNARLLPWRLRAPQGPMCV